MIIRSFKIFLLACIISGIISFLHPVLSQTNDYKIRYDKSEEYDNKITFADSVNKKPVTKKSISAVFLGIGGGLSIPLSPFKNNSNVVFGALGRLEFASTSIFPVVIGVEVDYFSYSGADEFETQNSLNSLKTKIFSFGLNVEYSMAKIVRSSFTTPFLTIDVKNNLIDREYDDDTTFADLPREESKISIGAGIGFTLFVFDIYGKYNYMKGNSNIGVYIKTKVPILRF